MPRSTCTRYRRLDLYAPGTNIRSTDYLGRVWATMSDTSMAAPHVAGAAAVYWSLHPTATGAQVAAAVKAKATRNILAFPFGQAGSPNASLNVDFPTKASAPRSLRVTPGTKAAQLAWVAPAFAGNTPVTGYRVEAQQGTGPWRVLAVRSIPTTYRAAGLPSRAKYRFRVATVNSQGLGPFVTSPAVTIR